PLKALKQALAPGATPGDPTDPTARAFIEMSHLLTLSLDLYHVADNLLLNLMGHLKTTRACLWLVPEGDASLPVLVKSRGVDEAQARLVIEGCAAPLMERSRARPNPLVVADLADGSVGSIREVADRAGLRFFAPIWVRGEILGILALGSRSDGAAYSDHDIRVLQACLAIAGVAMQNERFYGRLLERNRELRMANNRLTELDRLKSEFISNVNHELRTPLTAIIASLDCVARAQDDGAPQLLEYASTQSRKLLSMIENVLTFSEAEHHSLRPDFVTGDLVAAVSDYYLERLPGVSSELREFTCVREATVLTARFDEMLLRQLLDALIDNAVKFTAAGARIQLRVRRVAQDDADWIGVDVIDDGPGIPADRLAALFEPFQQLDGSMTRLVGGMGLGLSLAQRLAEGLGGRLTATSEPGKGCTFTLLLPAVVQFDGNPADSPDGRRLAMTNELEISKPEDRGGTVLLRVKGRLDVKTSPILLQRVAEIQANGQNLVLNLSEVSFMGSSGIGALLVLVEQFQEQGGSVRFASLSPAVDSVVKLLNLDRFLSIDPTESESLAALGT
ncbi:MAG TPA: anti-sigma factor antagonist, partial [Candidatus Eisenbacteria bacterium]|nr:anti-sigma factor antagonist [Candidatus Eisenbacteria bacterium]